MSSALFWGSVGVLVPLMSNSLRKLPLMRRTFGEGMTAGWPSDGGGPLPTLALRVDSGHERLEGGVGETGPWEHVLAFGGGIVFGNGVNSATVYMEDNLERVRSARAAAEATMAMRRAVAAEEPATAPPAPAPTVSGE
ncbi:hypothetical protein BU14_0014s0038 [Porphyra umbilicalis]|uniref:Uncharacterized protein n=1 Tax=Porphyra umbilicalis TaxID=2786 RepID=A0A1X6PKV6_PORUM|nr:hypothetical protein BU14_0014s0038 [Porphyra umbilicalis]|eukprot:OSX81487.1 hypothetical protein BU14_0014s0038 [Porphyra umbilicalis]